MPKSARANDAREAADACLAVLREDPPRLKRILRESAGLADDVSAVLADARRPLDSKKAHRVANMLRGAAFLPTAFVESALRAALEKLLAPRR